MDHSLKNISGIHGFRRCFNYVFRINPSSGYINFLSEIYPCQGSKP